MGLTSNRRFHPDRAAGRRADARQLARLSSADQLCSCSLLVSALLPLRSFDFWLPSLSLALGHSDLADHISRAHGGCLKISIGLSILLGLVTFIGAFAYFLPDPVLTATTPPQFIQYLIFILLVVLTLFVFTWLSPFATWTVSILHPLIDPSSYHSQKPRAFIANQCFLSDPCKAFHRKRFASPICAGWAFPISPFV